MAALLTLSLADDSFSWVGLELDASSTAVRDTWDTLGGDGGTLEASGRVLFQAPVSSFDMELHWLATAVGTFGDVQLAGPYGESPFRTLDMEKVHSESDRRALVTEVDRLTAGWSSDKMRVTLGRQAVTWGEAYYFNIGDPFGAFPITETNRLYKPGVDALTATAALGPFSDLTMAVVPSDDTEDNVALNLLVPLGTGSLTLTGGRILDDKRSGVGYTLDVGGVKLYGTFLLTEEDDGNRFRETVLGAESQIGPYTHMLCEIYANGWGTTDPDRYLSLVLSERYQSGLALALGKLNGAIQITRQMTPLFTVTPALFANISDGSGLVRLDGGWSLSDWTLLRGGAFAGYGERPEGGLPASEYGGAPFTVYLEVVHSI